MSRKLVEEKEKIIDFQGNEYSSFLFFESQVPYLSEKFCIREKNLIESFNEKLARRKKVTRNYDPI